MSTSKDIQRKPLLAKKSRQNVSKKPLPELGNIKSVTKSVVSDPPATTCLLKRRSSTTDSSLSDESLYIKDEHDLDSYFEGPLPLGGHSRLPYWMRFHGSIIPKMIVPLVSIGCWTTAVVYLIQRRPEFAVSNLLMNTLGFVVALALSFRSQTAYERYGDGRRAWTKLSHEARNMARMIWLHSTEREGDQLEKEDLLSKITAINLILAFALSLKHRLRFEPHTQYTDLKDMIDHLQTFAHEAFYHDANCHEDKGYLKRFGEYLGLPFAQSNPRRALYQSKKPLGNLPLEILNHLSVWTQMAIENGNLKMSGAAGSIMNNISSLTEVLGESERVLNTPLPIAYNIAFSQITLIYVYTLPFQLYSSLHYLTIPGTILAAYIILGLAAIGNSLENPFGHDNNDLNLDAYCEELSAELDMITSSRPPTMRDFVSRNENLVLAPISSKGFANWMARDKEDVWDALKAKSLLNGRRRLRLA